MKYTTIQQLRANTRILEIFKNMYNGTTSIYIDPVEQKKYVVIGKETSNGYKNEITCTSSIPIFTDFYGDEKEHDLFKILEDGNIYVSDNYKSDNVHNACIEKILKHALGYIPEHDTDSKENGYSNRFPNKIIWNFILEDGKKIKLYW